MKLVLEAKGQADKSEVAPGLMITPPVGNEYYWAYRVRLSGKQAIVGFPKFGTVGIGFAVEEDDWNVNLPYTLETEKIFQHIRGNKGDDAISDDDVRAAIRLVQRAARQDRDSK